MRFDFQDCLRDELEGDLTERGGEVPPPCHLDRGGGSSSVIVVQPFPS
jgi:hypothetical protein